MKNIQLAVIPFAVVLFMVSATSFGQQIRVKAIRDGSVTRFQMQVCIYWTPDMARDALDDDLEIVIGGDIEVTENDPIDDDELGDKGGSQSSGSFSVPPVLPGSFSNPLSNPTYTPFGPLIGPVNNDEYGNENPGEFQLGTKGGEEGEVPSGTSVTIPGTGTSTPSFPNYTS